jgi:hypothetical protein
LAKLGKCAMISEEVREKDDKYFYIARKDSVGNTIMGNSTMGKSHNFISVVFT